MRGHYETDGREADGIRCHRCRIGVKWWEAASDYQIGPHILCKNCFAHLEKYAKAEVDHSLDSWHDDGGQIT